MITIKKQLLVLLLMLCSQTLSAQELHKGFQLSFVTPVGTNGQNSAKTINDYSLNILGGYSYANTTFELGGLYNINKAYAIGFQLAGLVNVTGDMTGLQIAGLTNISRDVKGVQIAGLFNKAKVMNGVQIGLVNYAEKSNGVQLGLINISKYGGKHEFELAYSDAINILASFRLGNDYLYTIFSGGVNFTASQEEVNYAAGIGLGTQIRWNKGWSNEVELVCYSLSDGGSFNTELNLLNQARFTFTKQFAEWFKVFAGPVVNISVSDNSVVDSWSQYSIYEHIGEHNTVRGWIGLVAGFRF
ncbi:MAG: hypothetical protein R3Y49_05000 [Rikenellaceae bacterium]